MANYKAKNWQHPEVWLHCRFASQLRAAGTSNPSTLHIYWDPQRNLSYHQIDSRSVLIWALQQLCSFVLKEQTSSFLPMLKEIWECGEGTEEK